MDIRKGYVYHIKDEYFELVKDKTLMINLEDGKSRPTYFCIKNENTNILWFIPMSSKVEKYRLIRNKKLEKYGRCDTILIRKFLGKESVFLIQNMFPTTEKFVDHVHIINGVEAKVINSIAAEIEITFNKLMRLIEKGKKVVFKDIEKDIAIMMEELKKIVINNVGTKSRIKNRTAANKSRRFGTHRVPN